MMCCHYQEQSRAIQVEAFRVFKVQFVLTHEKFVSLQNEY